MVDWLSAPLLNATLKILVSFLCSHPLSVTFSHKYAVLLRMLLNIADAHFFKLNNFLSNKTN